eukprot:SAG22_NODE_5307_length_1040_cov_2.311371_1_plen_152_part_00
MGKGRGKGSFGLRDFQDAESHVKAGLCTVCVMLCIGPLMMLSGLTHMLAATTDSRGDAITSWNGAADKWQAAGLVSFQGIEFTGCVTHTVRGQCDGPLVPLHKATDEVRHALLPATVGKSGGMNALCRRPGIGEGKSAARTLRALVVCFGS